MKRKQFLLISLIVVFIGLAGIFQSFRPGPSAPPEPAYSTYKFIADHWYNAVTQQWEDYYALKYSVYQICHDGFGYYNEGPFYPNSTNNAVTYETSQWNVTYTTGTYARIWYKKHSNDDWTLDGDIYMDTSYNTTLKQGTSIVYTFTIDQQFVPEE
ncbi:MAG: hypothetical protein D4R64_16645 [Porphyromonadaceae bacterium]|nr:MAG: hypothetical protein D4R64_16645 [Porphyromonadaceae bacterium]